MTTTTIQKWGNSCAVRLPHEMLRRLDLQAGREVEIREDKQGAFFIVPATQESHSLANMIGRITKHNQHAAVDWSRPVGREVW